MTIEIETPEAVKTIKANMEAVLGHPLDAAFIHASGNWKLTYVNSAGVRIFYVTVVFNRGRWTPKACSHVLPKGELFELA